MSQPLIPPPEQIVPVAGLAEGKIPLPDDPMFGDSVQGTVQQGGRFAATAALRSFLTDRSAGYVKHISRPGTADRYCSRLSPHLTWGSLSVREVVKAINSSCSRLRLVCTTAKGAVCLHLALACRGVATLYKNSKISRKSNFNVCIVPMRLFAL